MNKADNSTVIPWESLSEGQKIKASPDIKSDIWWVRLKNGKYGLTINFNGIVHIDLAQIRFSGADANLADVNGKSVFALSIFKSIFSPTIISVSCFSLVSFVSTDPTYSPFLKIATLSEISITSLSLCVIIIIDFP